jgi:hypothetical protein
MRKAQANEKQIGISCLNLISFYVLKIFLKNKKITHKKSNFLLISKIIFKNKKKLF